MPNYNSFYSPNQPMINQLLRQKDNIDNLLNQYSQPQAPVQNIINTNSNLEFEARILSDNEDPMNIAINRKTLFVDEKNKKIIVKELDGSISKSYDIIVPLDEKDKQIIELTNKLKEMEVKINEYAKFIRTNDEQYESDANDVGDVKSTTKTSGKSVSKSAK